MIYLIPEENLDKLCKKVNRVLDKNANITFNVTKNIQWKKDSKNFYHKCYEVEVEGKYQIEGFEFAATLEHTENGNIIRNVIDVEIPERYRHCKPICEHCQTLRNRKDTYLIRELATGEFKQVGKSCLKDYTKGLDAELCANIASVMKAFNEYAFDEDATYAEFEMSMNANNRKFLDATYFKNLAYEEVKENGYVSKVTVATICSSKLDTKANDFSEKIAEIDKWVDEVDTSSSNYLANATLAWKLPYIDYKHFALIASLISYYFKDLQRKAKEELASASTNFVGEIGDKVTVNIKSIQALYSKSNGFYSYYAASSTVYKILDTKGNIYIWDTSKNQDELLNATQLVGTIKNHNIFKGEKQTIITRCKVTI